MKHEIRNIEHMEQGVDPQTQALLNKPPQAAHAMPEEERVFLEIILKKISDGSINLYRPSSLLNEPVFNSLTSENQTKADTDAANMLAAVREIKNLHDAGLSETYQMENTVNRLRITKERLEQIGGDIFII